MGMRTRPSPPRSSKVHSQDVAFLYSTGSSVGPTMAPWPTTSELPLPGLTLRFLQQLQLQSSSTDTATNEELWRQQRRLRRLGEKVEEERESDKETLSES